MPTPADLLHPRQRRTSSAAVEPDHTPPEEARAGSGTPSSPPPGVPAGGDPGVAPAPPRPRSSTWETPTPGTLPRPSRTSAEPASNPRAAEPSAGEPGGRRIFPNPSSIMSAGRARKVRGGLRARRLPKVEETSAGGVVLDLASVPPAVALIARHDRRSRLLWSLPKGHVEAGETPEQTALREVHEETGLIGRIVAPLGVIDFWFVVEDKRIHKTVHHYVIEAIGGELCDDDLEVEAVAWIPYDQVVRKLAYGDERRLVEKVAQIVPGVR